MGRRAAMTESRLGGPVSPSRTSQPAGHQGARLCILLIRSANAWREDFKTSLIASLLRLVLGKTRAIGVRDEFEVPDERVELFERDDGLLHITIMAHEGHNLVFDEFKRFYGE